MALVVWKTTTIRISLSDKHFSLKYISKFLLLIIRRKGSKILQQYLSQLQKLDYGKLCLTPQMERPHNFQGIYFSDTPDKEASSGMRSDVVLGMGEVTQISAFPRALIRLCIHIAPSLHPWYLKHFTTSVLFLIATLLSLSGYMCWSHWGFISIIWFYSGN